MAYLEGAESLFAAAAEKALAAADCKTNDVDIIVTISSTGIATPSLEARVASRMEHARQLLSFLDALRPLHPGLGRFHFYDKRTKTALPADTLEACEAALQAGVVVWRTGRVDQTSYQQRFFVERRDGTWENPADGARFREDVHDVHRILQGSP